MKVSLILKDIRKDKFLWFRYQGICELFDRRAEILWAKQHPLSRIYPSPRYVFAENRNAAFEAWSMFSGVHHFPVPTSMKARGKRYSAVDAYNCTIFKWNPLTKYGRARRHLLNHLIVWFSERGM